MKDKPKKIGAVALAGVMVAGGTLQSGAVVANAEGVNDRVNTKVSTMSDGHVDIIDEASVFKKLKEWNEVWTSDLRDIRDKRHPNYRRNMYLRQIYGQLNREFKNIEILGFGRKAIVDPVYNDAKFFLKDFDFEAIEYHYNTVNELKTGRVAVDDRVVNLKGNGPRDYGAIPISQFQKGKYYKITIGDYKKITNDTPICHIFLYVKK